MTILSGTSSEGAEGVESRSGFDEIMNDGDRMVNTDNEDLTNMDDDEITEMLTSESLQECGSELL
jgi:hypothetical protein